jgi:hypothetical protein
MREIIIVPEVKQKINDLEEFLVREYKMSRAASHARVVRIYKFIGVLALSIDFAPCRFKRWSKFGYRCMSYQGWVFAYEVVPEGVIIRDMSHGAKLNDPE